MGDDEQAWSYLLVMWSSLVLPSCLLTRYPCTNNYYLIFLSLGGTRYDARASQPLWAGLFDFEHKPQQTMNESAFQCFFFFFSQN